MSFFIPNLFISSNHNNQQNRFSECFKLTKINIPDSIKELGDGCFHKYHSLPQNFLHQSIITINRDCFSEYSQLTQINNPDSVKEFGEGCFYGCHS
jgi:hypothetical protein